MHFKLEYFTSYKYACASVQHETMEKELKGDGACGRDLRNSAGLRQVEGLVMWN